MISESDFLELCINNPDINFERNADKSIVIMAPTFSETGRFNVKLITQVEFWNNRNSDPGYVFDSNTGFTLPNGAVRSPDVSWIEKSRYDSLPNAERYKFACICPDFVIELKSLSDSVAQLRSKMDEYKANGCRLGFLIDPEARQVHIFYNDKESVKSFPDEISGHDVLPGFILDLTIFDK